MMSNSRRSAMVMIAHLPIDQAGGWYCYDCRKFEKVAEMNRTSNTPIEENDLRLLLVICKVTLK
jgi:hypothetical protein